VTHKVILLSQKQRNKQMVKKAKAQVKMASTEPQPKYDVNFLSGVVSHNDATNIIYKHIIPLTLSASELKQFKRDLLKASAQESLNASIVEMLDEMIAVQSKVVEENQDETVVTKDQD